MELYEIEKALIKRYRTKLYVPFVKAINDFDMIADNDKIAVCISGGKDGFTLAKLFQELHKHGKKQFDLVFLVMDPGYNEANLKLLKENAEKLGIPIVIEKSEIFAITEKQEENPCYLCARMRRGFLYKAAQDLGCNKIALGHHMNDVIETTMLNILYAGCFKTMMPKLKSKNFEGMEVIRPMYYIKEKDIITYMKYSEIDTMQCGCRIASRDLDSKREEVKQLIKKLKKTNPVIEKHIFKTALNVNLDCVIEWEYNNKKYNFMDFYSESKKSDDD